MFLDVILDTLVAVNRTSVCQGHYSIQYSPNQCFMFTIKALNFKVIKFQQFNEFLKSYFPAQ